MAKNPQLSASLLAADYGMLRSAIQRADNAGVNRFHLDFMDGHYVPNIALSPEHISALRPFSALPFDVHLELANPDEVIDQFAWEGVSTLILQADTLPAPARVFKKVRSFDMHIGLSVNPGDPIEALIKWLPEIDQFLILGVQPGFGGQPMDPDTLGRVREIAGVVKERSLSLEIAVDGGVTLDNAADLIDAGADVLVVGTAIFGNDDIEGAVKALAQSLLAAKQA